MYIAYLTQLIHINKAPENGASLNQGGQINVLYYS